MTATDRLTGRVALVTGGAHGIGRAVVRRLAAEGAAVVVADVDREAAGRTAAEVAADRDGAWAGGVHAVGCDVTRRADLDAAVAAAVGTFGGLDVVVAGVGVSTGTAFEDIGPDDWAAQAGPTLHGAVTTVQAALPHLLAAGGPGGGSVVLIGSVNGLAAVGDLVYATAKAGLVNLAANLAVRYGRREQARRDPDARGVRFNVVAPGTVRTRVWTDRGPERLAQLDALAAAYPAGRVGEPEDVAAAVAYLASDDAAWVTGVTLPVDGGLLTGPLATGGMS